MGVPIFPYDVGNRLLKRDASRRDQQTVIFQLDSTLPYPTLPYPALPYPTLPSQP